MYNFIKKNICVSFKKKRLSLSQIMNLEIVQMQSEININISTTFSFQIKLRYSTQSSSLQWDYMSLFGYIGATRENSIPTITVK